MSKHRRGARDNGDPLLPATVEQLAALERKTAPERRRAVTIAVAVAATFAVAATAWAVTGPDGGTAAPTGDWATGVSKSFTDGFGDAPSPTPLPPLPPRSQPQPSVSAAPSAAPLPSRGFGLAPVPGAAPAPDGLTVGGARSLRAGDAADVYVYAVGDLAAVGPVTPGSPVQTRQAATYTVVAGLADSRCFSFHTVDGRWLRHRDYRLHLDPDDGSALLRADATFCARDSGRGGTVRFESYNYPGYYLHRRDGGLWIDRSRRDRDFDVESTFVVTGPWV
ncbi:AbfB domain-containing protein [Catellatospora tritici]|uniref:AbfB domain-containing protein n=1 Tax=Catellatospora tritici TaxID=2851566 RepID=UPI001C2D3E0F|nr:AbfB domain-containing protein [Catellatospora tritici]MBV1851749.1 AbfB domain-containing protein [Catellatospora tritici]